jgi:hypothetical protein
MKTLIFSAAFVLVLSISPVFAQKVSNYDHNANAGVNHASANVINPSQSGNFVKSKAPVSPDIYQNIPKTEYATYIPDLWFNMKIVNPDAEGNNSNVVVKNNKVTQAK